jgi:hypothetical protein
MWVFNIASDVISVLNQNVFFTLVQMLQSVLVTSA